MKMGMKGFVRLKPSEARNAPVATMIRLRRQ
jgi:hypothetical protein